MIFDMSPASQAAYPHIRSSVFYLILIVLHLSVSSPIYRFHSSPLSLLIALRNLRRGLASRLGLELYDRKKLEEEAKKLGKLDENKEFFQEKAVNSLLYSIAVSYGDSNPMEKSFELIRELTQQKSAVIIGRCSGAIYANDPEATTVFLHADKDCRIKRVMERDGINEKKAAKLIKEVDEKRASFHKFCTGKEWEDASQYQLSIDTGKLDISDAADMIINYINAKNIGQKHL